MRLINFDKLRRHVGLLSLFLVTTFCVAHTTSAAVLVWDSSVWGDDWDGDNDVDNIADSVDPDDDNDSMPDSWENTYSLNPWTNDASDNPDGDAYTNLQEYQNGTSPIVFNSANVARNDLDDDGDSDVLIRSASTGAWTRYTVQNAAVTGNGAISAYTSSSIQYVAQLDANGDGDADILTRNTSTGVWYLHQVQAGAVTSTSQIYLYASLDQQFVGVGDFNGDGTQDVMLRSASGGHYTVFLLANHAVSSTVFYNAWLSASSVNQGIGDFDGDGIDDLLVRRTSDNLYFIFRTINGGTSSVYCACNLWLNPHWTFQFAGDTNDDGTDDVVIRGTGATGDGFWWNFRMSNFSSTQTTNLNTFKDKTLVSLAASGDYNGDGHTDMLVRVNNGPVYVARIVNGTVSGNTTLLYNFTADQLIQK